LLASNGTVCSCDAVASGDVFFFVDGDPVNTSGSEFLFPAWDDGVAADNKIAETSRKTGRLATFFINPPGMFSTIQVLETVGLEADTAGSNIS
jgi:hypothetical protein